MCDTEVQHQRHRTRHIHEITSQFNVPTSLTPALSHLLCFHFVGCVKEVNNLIWGRKDQVVYFESIKIELNKDLYMSVGVMKD